jgi:hypothetical protein
MEPLAMSPQRVPLAQCVDLPAVLAEELTAIGSRRESVHGFPHIYDQVQLAAGQDADQRLTVVRNEALRRHLVGLSFSGGGIRSGTFAVGFLQGIASLRLLRRIDYLSTVSGGGYAGGWLAAWLKREGQLDGVEAQLSPSRFEQSQTNRHPLGTNRVVDEEPEPLFHLRENSSYLFSRPGLLTADTWSVITIWLRNVSINMMMLLPMALVVVLIARIIVYLFEHVSHDAIARSDDTDWLKWGLFVAGLVFLTVGVVINALALGEFRTRAGSGTTYRTQNTQKRLPGGGALIYIIACLVGLAAVILTIPLRAIIWLAGERAASPDGATSPATIASIGDLFAWIRDAFGRAVNADPGLLGLPNILAHALSVGVLLALGALATNGINRVLQTDVPPHEGNRMTRFLRCYFGAACRYSVAAFVAGATGGGLLTLLELLTRTLDDAAMPGLAATIIPPFALLIVVTSFVVEVALVGRQITEAEREWWARLSALLLIAAILWASALATVVYVPAVFLWAGIPVRVAVTSGWLVSTAFAVVSGRYALPKFAAGGNSLATIAAFLPPIFLAGLIGAVSLLAAYFVHVPDLDFSAGATGYFQGMAGSTLPALAVALGFAYLAYWIASRLIDVNLFSLHAMYANRLIRCYLGASRPKDRWPSRWGGLHDPRAGGGAPSLAPPAQDDRNPNPATGFDLSDDIPLFNLRIGEQKGGRSYWGPHLLINTTLNLVAGGELAWRDRKGESFAFTPFACGSKGTGYARVAESTSDNLTLGRVITISGAAVDPSMKFYQSAALTALLTIFNARLGYWMQNPAFKPWNAESPEFGERLWYELFGQTDATDPFIHLSDGGHFENLGVYELVRRRCRHIIAVDAGEDADASSDNLAELIRLCRIDFGVRIELDTRPLLAEGPDRLTRTHVVVGRVRYDDVDSGQIPGTIVYVKISLTGDEPADIQKYAKKDRRFPHQPTDLRQSFDEEQFESYRALGEHIARIVFEDAASIAEVGLTRPNPSHLEDYVEGNKRLFSALRTRWAQSPATHDASYVNSAQEWTALMRDMRDKTSLGDLSAAMYPETPDSVDQRIERHTVAQMLQIMEDAWIGLGLKVNRDLPMDRGWMNVFRRWANTDALRRHWPAFRTEFSPDFARFCESELHLVTATPALLRVPRGYTPASFEGQAIAIMAKEFAREWPKLATPEDAFPGVPRPRRGLTELVARAAPFFAPADPPIWIAAEAPAGHGDAGQSPEKFPSAIFLLCDYVAVREDAVLRTVTSRAVPNTFELVAWVRRSHRSLRLASRFIETIIHYFKTNMVYGGANWEFYYAVRPQTRLRVRYPKSGKGSDTDSELEVWRSFFALHEFKPVQAENPSETVMELVD